VSSTGPKQRLATLPQPFACQLYSSQQPVTERQ
jgi:hypothetical protein